MAASRRSVSRTLQKSRGSGVTAHIHTGRLLVQGGDVMPKGFTLLPPFTKVRVSQLSETKRRKRIDSAPNFLPAIYRVAQINVYHSARRSK